MLSKEIKEIGQTYLHHEFRKILSDVEDQKIWAEIDRSIGTFLEREGEESFWNLLFGISEGWKTKYVAHILSDTKYDWKLEEFPLSKITLTGMSPVIDKYVITECNRNPRSFGEKWKKSEAMRKEIKSSGFSEHEERDSDPIFLYQKNKEFHVFDGMRRTLLAVIKNEDKIRAWVGYEKNSEGKPMISVGRCLFLADMLKLYSGDKKVETSIAAIAEKVSAKFRNGRQVLVERIANWSHDENVKEILGGENKK